jgi:hypothetical protein
MVGGQEAFRLTSVRLDVRYQPAVDGQQSCGIAGMVVDRAKIESISSHEPISSSGRNVRNAQLTRFNHHWLAFRLPSLLALLALAAIPLSAIDIETCPFELLTGIPCPFCGLSRSVSCLLHVDIARSWAYHPLGIATLLFLVSCLITNKPDFFPALLEKRTGLNIRGTTGWMVLLAFTIVWLVRLSLSGVYL